MASPTRRAIARAGFGGFGALACARLASGAPAPMRTVSPDSRNGSVAADAHRGTLHVDVTDFGARGDGETDDSNAINAAFAEARRARPHVHGIGLGCQVVFPAGAYLVRSPLDLTHVRHVNTLVEGQGSAIIGSCAGKPVIDAMGSRWLTMRDLTIVGDRGEVPSTGLQIGVAAPGEVADDHRLENLKILGCFGLSCLYNRAAETSTFDHLLLWNDQPGGHCLIQDGCNHFDVHSAFAHRKPSLDGAMSFNENIFIGCDFRHGAGGTPVWLGDTTRHAFVRCYSATHHGPSFLLHCGSNGHTMLDVDCHCETFGLQEVFRFSSPAPATTVRGFSYRDHASYAARAVFSADEPLEISIENASIDVATYRSQSCRVFDANARFAVTGSYYSTSRQGWNGNPMFRGMASFGRALETFGVDTLRAGWGDTSQRPQPETTAAGQLYFDHSLGKLLVWNGNTWRDTNVPAH